MFAVVSYTLATEEAERIGVDHIARMSMSGLSENSAVSEQLASTYGAIKMLHSRINLIVDYLKAIATGAHLLSIKIWSLLVLYIVQENCQ